jgi:hypothetical protein
MTCTAPSGLHVAVTNSHPVTKSGNPAAINERAVFIREPWYLYRKPRCWSVVVNHRLATNLWFVSSTTPTKAIALKARKSEDVHLDLIVNGNLDATPVR